MRGLTTRGFIILTFALAIIVGLNIFNFLADQDYRRDSIDRANSAKLERANLATFIKASNERFNFVLTQIFYLVNHTNVNSAEGKNIVAHLNSALNIIAENQIAIGKVLNVTGVRDIE